MTLHSHPRLHRGECLGIPYVVDVSDWRASRQAPGLCFEHVAHRLIWNLQCGGDVDPAIYDARRDWTSARVDDRALYDQMCSYAEGYFADAAPAEPQGVHLFFLDGASHFAVTYRRGAHWKRRYSVMLVEPQTYKAAEFVFTFQFDGTFRQYCLLAQTMDAVVKSLRWRADEGARDPAASDPSTAPGRIDRLIDDMPAANKLLDRGMALMKRGRLAEGIPVLEQALRYSMLAEMRGMVHFNLGRAYERLRDLDNAVRHYEASVAANPGQFNALANLGAILHRMGDAPGALEHYLRAAEINPRDYVTTHNIAVCYEDLGDEDNALKWRSKLRGLKR
jgi:tetratricopeptide (TPR) repeat protein